MSLLSGSSFSFGKIKFNISQSGITISTGTNGFSIGLGTQSFYVQLGQNGFKYKKTFKKGNGIFSSLVKNKQDGTCDKLKEIDSFCTDFITDSSSMDIVEDIRTRRRKIRFFPFSLAITVLCAIIPQIRILIVVGIISNITLFFIDRKRKICSITYKLEEDMQKKLNHLLNAFHEITNARKKWHIEAEGNVSDSKKASGADISVSRKEIKIKYARPAFIKTNVTVPSLPTGKQTMYFFPDRLFIVEKKKVAALEYSTLQIEYGFERFVENGDIHSDTKVLDYTWKYVNKSGEPDQRFKNNRSIPVVSYPYVHFKSVTGLNERIQLSASDFSFKIAEALQAMQCHVAFNESSGLTKHDCKTM